MGGGDRYFCKKVSAKVGQKGQLHSVQICDRYAVGSMQYTVGVSAKRSTHTVDLANMGGGDCYL